MKRRPTSVGLRVRLQCPPPPGSPRLTRHISEANNYNNLTKKPPDRGCFSKLAIKVDQNYAGKSVCVFAMCPLHVFPAAPLFPL